MAFCKRSHANRFSCVSMFLTRTVVFFRLPHVNTVVFEHDNYLVPWNVIKLDITILEPQFFFRSVLAEQPKVECVSQG